MRYAVNDDPHQAKLAATVLAGHKCFVLSTVILETVWVLESVYEYSVEQIFERLIHIITLPTVAIDAYPAVLNALERYRAGMDFADALHLSLSEAQDKEGMITFDKKLANTATRIGVQHSVTLIR